MNLSGEAVGHLTIVVGRLAFKAASCVDGPRHARAFLREGQRLLAVMCPAFLFGHTWAAGVEGFRGLRPYQLVGI